MKKLQILTGKIRSGKTTRLMLWAASQKNTDGILQPFVEGKRFIYRPGSKTLKQLEVEHFIDTVKIGKYNFSVEAFTWAQSVLNECSHKKLDWLIIDEIGPLELEGKGLEPIVTKIISQRDSYSGNILCVVRDTILEKFIDHYDLKDSYEIFNDLKEQE